jgi:hypothetical protein
MGDAIPDLAEVSDEVFFVWADGANEAEGCQQL